MDMDEIRRLIDLGEKKGLSEFEVEKSGVRVRIKYSRGAEFIRVPPGGVATNPGVPVEGLVQSAENSVSTAPLPPVPEELEDKERYVVKSPIVGTFYASPDPTAPSFVKVGDRVKAGQVLCIVEAMKLMNEIESEVSGELIKVYVENAQPVEYGEPLFAIRVS
ncbi:MAG: acetyl-CoA carboxylase biotin carboxyl carrier protein [Acidobacteriia bacterium]|nr:acetyl-CoA carboxylase biotin carboxyl carrier protein [Terriglobia bacterium]